MSFRDNLLHLRATRNMTQEQLAVMVGVSRQSVTKWESERAVPEMDKLLKLCDIFDCSLDDLVRGDLTTREADPQLAVPTAALAEDVVGYDDHYRTFARRIALGVTACIMGLAFANVLDAIMGDGPTTAALFVCIAAGLALIIPAGLEHAAFQKAHPYIANFYTDEERLAAKGRFGKMLVVGISAILLGIVIGAFSDTIGNDTLVGMAFFTCIAVGSGIIVHESLLMGRVDVEEYNISALEELDEEEIAGIVGEDRAPVVLNKVRRSKKTGAVCGVIMLIATAIALPLMFWATQADNTFWIRFFWIPWMVGGLLCGIASIIISSRK